MSLEGVPLGPRSRPSPTGVVLLYPKGFRLPETLGGPERRVVLVAVGLVRSVVSRSLTVLVDGRVLRSGPGLVGWSVVGFGAPLPTLNLSPSLPVVGDVRRGLPVADRGEAGR